MVEYVERSDEKIEFWCGWPEKTGIVVCGCDSCWYARCSRLNAILVVDQWDELSSAGKLELESVGCLRVVADYDINYLSIFWFTGDA